MPGTLRVETEPRANGAAVVRISGRLDFTSVAAARAQVVAAIAAGQSRIVADLSGTEFVDSAGLGCLLGGMRAARAAGGDLRIADPSPQVTVLLSLTRMDQVFAVDPTVEEALGGFS